MVINNQRKVNDYFLIPKFYCINKEYGGEVRQRRGGSGGGSADGGGKSQRDNRRVRRDVRGD